MKTLTITEAQAKELYKDGSASFKKLLEEHFGKLTFAERPKGVWILTMDRRALTIEAYKALDEKPEVIGIGVSTDETAFIVSPFATQVLPFGATSVVDYDDIVCDEDTYDNLEASLAIHRAHTGVEFNIWDDERFPAIGSPAIESCLMLHAGLSWAMPTLATLKVMSREVENINKALYAAGLPVLYPSYHWSSTVNKDYNTTAFVVSLYHGYVNYYRQNNYNYVRAVSAFHFGDFEFLIFDTMNEFKFTAEENSFIIEADGKKLRVSYDEKTLNWANAQEWRKKNGGGDESVENLRLLAKYRDDINKELEALGREVLDGWMWSNERGYINPEDFAFVVSLCNGNVYYRNQNDSNYVRAVSAL